MIALDELERILVEGGVAYLSFTYKSQENNESITIRLFGVPLKFWTGHILNTRQKL
jgi:hypothetical protein